MPKKVLTEQEQILKEIIKDLDKEINEIRPEALKRASTILNREVAVSSLNGIFGGKNNTYVDSVRTQFVDFDDFFGQWIKGLNDTFTKERAEHLRYNAVFDWESKASFRNIRLLQDDHLFYYARKLLERNFYKYINERVRLKPDENLWSVWFGYQLAYGVLIAPVKRAGVWTNDKSEIRKVPYNYWTVGHIMSTGLIDPSLDEPITFSTLNDFYKFYQSVLKRSSKSDYEKEIYDLYIAYLKASSDVNNEPFLIPEFRYAGLEKKHEHRLDFTILNQHFGNFTGFEISPASSHMSIKKLKEKQSAVNDELREKWGKEMAKRNKYFKSFGVTTITFADADLKDVGKCFEVIKEHLAKRPRVKLTLSEQIDRLNSF
jgi:hypothetical protein